MTPQTICGYAVQRSLGPASWLARDDRDHPIVLKKLDDSCLLQGKLHPAIVDRLSRVRELATTRVANLHGVERDGADSYLVWKYLEGRSLAEVEAAGEPTVDAWREAATIVEQMHRLGIVHGAVHAGNIIVGQDGEVSLTHVSPLLHHDPAVDERALSKHEISASPLMAGKTIRWRIVAAALLVGAVGVVVSAAIAWALSR